MPSARHLRLILASLLLLPLGGCLFRSHPVVSHINKAPVKTATRDELIARINSEAAAIKTLNATVDITTAVGGQIKGKVTQYQQIRGYILMRKPDMLRMIGLLPVIRNRAFDMVSNGQTFKLSIPPQNKFVVGRNDISATSAKKLENLRPQMISDALLIRGIDPQNEIAVLENTTEPVTDPKTHQEVDQPEYVIIVIRRDNHDWVLERKIIFSRADLQPHRQLMYDKNGYVVSDVRYDNFADYEGVSLPNDIHIWRPQEEYSIDLHMVKVQINQPLTDEQFVLNQPPGAQLVHLGESGTPPAAANTAQPRERSQ
jgi:outer membrane lipoprotein-sorting protein